MYVRASSGGGGGGGSSLPPVNLRIQHPAEDSTSIIMSAYDKDNTQVASQTVVGSFYGYTFNGTLNFTIDGNSYTWNINRDGLLTTDNYINATFNGMSFRWDVAVSSNMAEAYNVSRWMFSNYAVQGSITSIQDISQ